MGWESVWSEVSRAVNFILKVTENRTSLAIISIFIYSRLPNLLLQHEGSEVGTM